MYYYHKNEDGSVLDWSLDKFAEDCLETDKDIVQAWNGMFYLEDEVPEMPPDVAAAKALAEAKEERAESVSGIRVTVDGMVFDGDEVAQQRLARAIMVAEITGMNETQWVMADNTVHTITVTQAKEALSKAMLQMGELWTVPYQA